MGTQINGFILVQPEPEYCYRTEDATAKTMTVLCHRLFQAYSIRLEHLDDAVSIEGYVKVNMKESEVSRY